MTKRWLITGTSGLLGGHVLRELLRTQAASGILAWNGRGGGEAPNGVRAVAVDLMDAGAVAGALRAYRPSHVIHIAAMTAVGEAHARPEEALRINHGATALLAHETAACGGRFVYTSTDMVFDGEGAPYDEHATPNPVSHYGRSKLAGEAAALAAGGALVVRIPLLYGFPATPRDCTFASQIRALRNGEPLRLFTDEYRTPIWVVDAARALIALAAGSIEGTIHVAGPQRLSRLALIEQAARLLGVESPRIEPISRLSVGGQEPRPADLSLIGDRFRSAYPDLVPRPMGVHVFE